MLYFPRPLGDSPNNTPPSRSYRTPGHLVRPQACAGNGLVPAQLTSIPYQVQVPTCSPPGLDVQHRGQSHSYENANDLDPVTAPANGNWQPVDGSQRPILRPPLQYQPMVFESTTYPAPANIPMTLFPRLQRPRDLVQNGSAGPNRRRMHNVNGAQLHFADESLVTSPTSTSSSGSSTRQPEGVPRASSNIPSLSSPTTHDSSTGHHNQQPVVCPNYGGAQGKTSIPNMVANAQSNSPAALHRQNPQPVPPSRKQSLQKEKLKTSTGLPLSPDENKRESSISSLTEPATSHERSPAQLNSRQPEERNIDYVCRMSLPTSEARGQTSQPGNLQPPVLPVSSAQPTTASTQTIVPSAPASESTKSCRQKSQGEQRRQKAHNLYVALKQRLPGCEIDAADKRKYALQNSQSAKVGDPHISVQAAITSQCHTIVADSSTNSLKVAENKDKSLPWPIEYQRQNGTSTTSTRQGYRNTDSEAKTYSIANQGHPNFDEPVSTSFGLTTGQTLSAGSNFPDQTISANERDATNYGSGALINGYLSDTDLQATKAYSREAVSDAGNQRAVPLMDTTTDYGFVNSLPRNLRIAVGGLVSESKTGSSRPRPSFERLMDVSRQRQDCMDAAMRAAQRIICLPNFTTAQTEKPYSMTRLSSERCRAGAENSHLRDESCGGEVWQEADMNRNGLDYLQQISDSGSSEINEAVRELEGLDTNQPLQPLPSMHAITKSVGLCRHTTTAENGHSSSSRGQPSQNENKFDSLTGGRWTKPPFPQDIGVFSTTDPLKISPDVTSVTTPDDENLTQPGGRNRTVLETEVSPTKRSPPDKEETFDQNCLQSTVASNEVFPWGSNGCGLQLFHVPSTNTKELPGTINRGKKQEGLGFPSPNPGTGTMSAPPGTPVRQPLDDHILPKTMCFDAKMNNLVKVRESIVSLRSTSSTESMILEQQAKEVMKLRYQLEQANRKVDNLSGRLTFSAHVVSVFEENLTKMSQRLQAMTQTTSKKESDLHDLRNTIDLLRSQSGLLKQQTDYSEKTVSEVNPPCREVMPECVDGARTGMEGDPKAPGSKRNGWLRQSIEKAFRKKPIGQPSASHKLTNGLDPTPDRDTVARSSAQPPSSTWACDSPLLHEGPPGSRIPRNDATIETRLRSGDLSPSNSSVVSASSTWSSSRSRATATGVATPKPCGAGINHDPEDKLRKPVAERSSTLRHPEDDQSPSDFSEGTLGDASQSSCQDAVCPPTELLRLHQMLTEREMKLTDVQLQALARAHQIDDLSGQMKQLYAEVRYLRADNERLQVALSQQQQQGSVRCASRVGMPIDESGKGVDLQKHNSAPFGDHSDAIGAKMHQVSMLVSLESLAPDVSQRFKNPCPVSMGELALAFTQADCVKTWSDLDMRLHRILTQYIDRLGVRSFLGKEGLNLSGYLVEANNHSVRYRRNLRTATRVTCRTTNQAEDQPCNLEFMDVLQTLALSNSKRLKIGLHLDDWLDEFSLRSLLPKHWLGTMFNFLQTYKCLVFFSENPDELRETTELFAAQLKKTGKVSSVCPLSIDQAGLSAVKLARVIHESLRLADEYGRSLSTSSQAVRLVTIDNLQLVKSSITVLEALDLIRTTEKEPTKLPSGNSLLILANWVMEDRGRQSPGLDLPPHTVQATSTIFCTGKQCCWAAADRTTVTKGNQSDDGPRLHESQQLHQRLLNKIFIEAMDCPVGKNGDDIAHSRIEAAKTVASWLAELSLRMQGLHSTGFGPLTTGMLSAAKPATTSLMDWPALVAQDLGEAWFLANWNEHVRPVLQAASVRASTPADGLLEWVVSTWPWQGSDRQRQLRLQHCMFRLDLMPATDS